MKAESTIYTDIGSIYSEINVSIIMMEIFVYLSDGCYMGMFVCLSFTLALSFIKGDCLKFVKEKFMEFI